MVPRLVLLLVLGPVVLQGCSLPGSRSETPRQAAATATAVVVASTCAVFANTEAEIAITVRGPQHWSVCGRIVHIGNALHETDVSGDFDIHLYSLECTAQYERDTIKVYEYGAPPDMVTRACTAFRRHTLPVLNGDET